jgi:riboflavin transporter FmnP
MGQSVDGYVETESLTTTHWIALLLVLVTGVIHVFAGLVEGRIPVLLAGVGFLGAAGLFLMDYRRTLLYLVGIVYTAVQVPLWYVAKAGEYTPVGFVDKTIQAALIVVLAYLYWQQRQAPDRRTEATAA